MTGIFTNSRAQLIALALVAGLATATATSAAANADTAKRNEAVVRAAFDRWSAGGNVFEILDQDIVWTIHGSGPIAGTYRGIDDFISRGARPLVSRLNGPLVPKLHDVWAQGDRVIIRFEASGTTNSGAPYDNQYVWIFRMEDRSVVEAEAFLDLVAYQQVLDNSEPRAQ